MSLTLLENASTSQRHSAYSLEERLRTRAAGLGMVQLESEHWQDLHRALDASAAGRASLVARWVDAAEADFLSAWEGYEQSDVLASEVTEESVLGHRLLLEGIESWLEALAELRTSGYLGRASILAQAELGQRLLVAVQLLQAPCAKMG